MTLAEMLTVIPRDHTALVAPGRLPFCYGGLVDQCRQISETLRSCGLRPDHRLASVISDGPDAAAALFAVSSICSWAPLNPALTSSEMLDLYSRLKVKGLLVEAGLHPQARAAAAQMELPVFDLTPRARAGEFGLTGRLSDAAGPLASESDVALVLQTSGSTGEPKVAPLTHRNLVSAAHQTVLSLALTDHDRAITLAPLFHVGALNYLAATLCAGGTAILPPPFRSDRFLAWMREFEPSWYNAPASIHQAIATVLTRESLAHRLRFVRSAAGPMPIELSSRLEGLLGVPFIEAYGMTEAIPLSSNPLPPGVRKAGSAGLATKEVELLIVGTDFAALAAGERGEIVVRGPNVIEAYDDPQQTREGFVNGYLRTGDLGYLDSDGYLFVTGRLKDIVNRGGEKISPREIDDALLEHPAVQEAAAFSIPHPTLGEDIGAAVILSQPVGPEELRRHLLSRLAAFKVPASIHIVEKLPRSPAGKVLRQKVAESLPQPRSERGVETPTEKSPG